MVSMICPEASSSWTMLDTVLRESPMRWASSARLTGADRPSRSRTWERLAARSRDSGEVMR